MRLLIFILTFLFQVNTFCQTFTFEQFKQQVLLYHPVVKQATNTVKFGEKELLKAKGSLDPKFTSELGGKEYGGKEYYNLSNSALKIPTWLGIDFKTGYEVNRGVYLSEENSTPTSGLWYAGVEIPLGQGLFFDERRAAIKSAQVFKDNSENEKRLIINDLLLDAYSAYWLWYEAYQKLKIAEEGLQFATVRFNGVKENALQGDVPIIDTVEAKIQLDNRKIEVIQQKYDYENSQQLLNLYLWTENFIPLEIQENAIPQVNQLPALNLEKYKLDFSSSTLDSLPLLMTYLYKLEQLQIEERLKKEMLKPQVNLAYIPLSKPVGNNPVQNLSINNYKFGVSVYVPLFLRKERGGLKQTKIKIENINLDIAGKKNEIKQKEAIIKNDLQRYYEQINIQQKQVSQAKNLRDSEQTRFEIGESSLFLVNSRELSYLSYKTKLAEIEAKLFVTEAKLKWLYSDL